MSDPSSLLGRAEEWKRLVDATARVRDGSFRAVFIHGEAGIGKTRLIQELTAHAEASGFVVLSGRAEALERMRPFSAIADAVAAFARKDDERRSDLQSFLRTLSGSANPVEVTDRFVELIEESAVSRPTCVVLEDLHWADADTIVAARALTRRLAYLPVLLAATYRPHPQSSELGRFVDAAGAEGATVIELGRLDDDAMRAHVERIVGGEVGPQLAKMLGAASGNPLYAAELAHALREEGVLRFDDGMVDADITELPPTLRLTILRRLSQFPQDVVEVLKHAAVLGSAFHLHELAAVTGRTVATLARDLDGPLAAKIIEERHSRLAFRHDLIHEAIYQDIPTPIRASMHVEAAGAFRALDVPAVRLAEHMIRGLDLQDPALFDDAVSLVKKVYLAAPLIGLALANKALELPGVAETRRDELRRFMVWPLVMTGRRDDAIRLGREALRRPQDPLTEAGLRYSLSMAHAEDGRAREAAAQLEALISDTRTPPAILRLARITLPAALARAGIFDRVFDFEGLLVEAREADDRLAVSLATGCLAIGLLLRGHIAEAVRRAEEYIEMENQFRTMIPTPYVVPAAAYLVADRFEDAKAACREGGRRASEAGELPAPSVYGPLQGYVAFLDGSWDEAIAECGRALELKAQGIGSAVCLVLAHATLAQIAQRRGIVEEARRQILEAERTLSERGPQWATDVLAWTKALQLESSGDVSEALDVFDAGWQAAAGGHHGFGRAAFSDLVRLAVLAGDHRRAEEVTEEAEEGRRKADALPSVVATALRCRGIVDDDAEALAAAVDAYRQSPRIVERAAACEDAAGAFVHRGEALAARDLFEEGLSIFEELGAVQDSSRILAAMRAAGIRRGSRARRRRAVSGWEALTPTEVEVTRLTVAGLTNPKIAERLYVSKYTVQTHLSHIFVKLQLSSRSELAVAAAKHGLA